MARPCAVAAVGRFFSILFGSQNGCNIFDPADLKGWKRLNSAIATDQWGGQPSSRSLMEVWHVLE